MPSVVFCFFEKTVKYLGTSMPMVYVMAIGATLLDENIHRI